MSKNDVSRNNDPNVYVIEHKKWEAEHLLDPKNCYLLITVCMVPVPFCLSLRKGSPPSIPPNYLPPVRSTLSPTFLCLIRDYFCCLHYRLSMPNAPCRFRRSRTLLLQPPLSKMEAIDTVAAAAAAAEATSSGKKEAIDAITDKVLDYYNKKHVFDFYNQVRAAVKRD